jgi:hypothetical protein
VPFTYTLTSNPGNLFNISGTQLRVNSSTIAIGSYPVTVRADDGFGTIIFQNLVLVATPPLTPMLRFNLAPNSQYVGTMIGGL